ncbi:MAG TPA: sigma-54 dependent transcriptional regulator [Candidatus Eisenbacteria bacterium]|nr:sigma-54 dependent transcriptional regulator [Candidatus Eisenbacteria bacterium]
MGERHRPVYVVDDDELIRDSLASLFRSAGLPVVTLASAQEFLVRSRTEEAGCLVLDVLLPGLSGLDLQQELAKANARIPIIFLTGHGDIPMSVRAMKSGALEFFTKPYDDQSVLAAVRQAMARADDAANRRKSGTQTSLDTIIGSSPTMKAVLRRATMVAQTDSTVLILGETGTGKELVARAIHALSSRSGRPLVSINCAAIQPSLITSELFGHEKGSFTGALHQRAGRFELADGGTMFLDEVGDLPAETQVALLRVLQEREFQRVGGNQTIRVDVRIVAATNRDLKAAIADGRFRSDLFYRLNVCPIHIPPLRERKEDIPQLVEHFLRMRAGGTAKQVRSVDAATLERLQSYSWPGNIRELQNVIERWAIGLDAEELSVGETMSAAPGPLESAGPGAEPPPGTSNFYQHREAVERKLIERTMIAAGGNQSEAARRLGLNRGSFVKLLKKYRPMTG